MVKTKFSSGSLTFLKLWLCGLSLLFVLLIPHYFMCLFYACIPITIAPPSLFLYSICNILYLVNVFFNYNFCVPETNVFNVETLGQRRYVPKVCIAICEACLGTLTIQLWCVVPVWLTVGLRDFDGRPLLLCRDGMPGARRIATCVRCFIKGDAVDRVVVYMLISLCVLPITNNTNNLAFDFLAVNSLHSWILTVSVKKLLIY